jgi:Ca-activated chloride channel family protein
MNLEFKIEQDCVKLGSRTALGLMLEVTAPVAKVSESNIQRAAKGIVFVIDRSGSMGGGRLELVKQTILDLLPRLNHDDHLGVVTFDDQAVVNLPMKRLSEQNIAEVRQVIGSLHTGGSTNLERGYRLGLAEATRVPSGVESTVILLSDGQANQGVVDPNLLGQLAAQATEHLISTSTLGIGLGYDENLLNALSVSGNGNHFAAVNQGEAAEGLTAEFDDLLTRTILGLQLEIEVHKLFVDQQTTVRKVQYLRKFRWDAPVAKADLGDLASGEEKNFVFELDLSALQGYSAGPVRAVTVRYSYSDAELGEVVKGEQSFDLRMIDPQDWVDPIRDENIVAELAALRANAERERAIDLMRQGRREEALEIMNRLGIMFDEFAASEGMSPRNRARHNAQSRVQADFMSMSNDEFIKRGVEEVHRSRKSKPDPRKSNNGDSSSNGGA